MEPFLPIDNRSHPTIIPLDEPSARQQPPGQQHLAGVPRNSGTPTTCGDLAGTEDWYTRAAEGIRNVLTAYQMHTVDGLFERAYDYVQEHY